MTSATPTEATHQPGAESSRRRYAVYGTGHRAGMYVGAMTGAHADVALPVAWCDTNEARMRHYDSQVRELGATPRHYAPDQLEQHPQRRHADGDHGRDEDDEDRPPLQRHVPDGLHPVPHRVDVHGHGTVAVAAVAAVGAR